MYKERKKSWTKHLDFLLVDVVCLEVAFFVSYFLRLGVRSWGIPAIRNYYSRLAILLVLVDLCYVFFSEPYSGVLRRNKIQELKKTIIHCTGVFLMIVVYIWGTKQGEIYSRQVVLVFWPLSIVLAYFARCAWKIGVRYRMLHGERYSKLIIISEDSQAEEYIVNFRNNQYREFEVEGIVIVDKDRTGEEICGIPVVADGSTCLEYIRTNVVDEVFLDGTMRAVSEALAEELLELGVTVHFNLVKSTALRPNKIVEECGNYLVLTSSMKIASTRQLFIKRAMDIAGSLVGLFLTGIAFLIFAPIIKIQSPGPVFYGQTRIGKNGRRFTIYKFRTMVVGADAMKKELMEQNEMDGLMFKMKNDPRIFPIGKFMRKFSIDEFPQFWNVLKGEMSLVGTRPPTEDEYKQYESHHKARLGIKPGLTGMWQVSGRSDIRNFEEIVALDVFYISNWSLGMDIRILFKTVLVVLTGEGSS